MLVAPGVSTAREGVWPQGVTAGWESDEVEKAPAPKGRGFDVPNVCLQASTTTKEALLTFS